MNFKSIHFAFLILFICILPFFKYYLFPEDEDQPNGCEMTYMWRQMHFLDVGLEDSHYSLFLYAEGPYAQKIMRTGQLDGLPVIFVPGNAGSGRQVRSIGSLLQNKSESRRTPFHFDVFALHFNEEFTAFHFDHIAAQSAFLVRAIDHVWSLYERKPPPGIVLVGHSMGGIVVLSAILSSAPSAQRTAFVMALATPFAEPPLYVDKRFQQLWTAIDNQFIGRRGESGASKLRLISISGGPRDEFIEESWTKAADFLTSTSALDRVWLDLDHKCILWCNQFIRHISRFLFDYAANPLEFLDNFKSHIFTHYNSIGVKLEKKTVASKINGNKTKFVYVDSSQMDNFHLTVHKEPIVLRQSDKQNNIGRAFGPHFILAISSPAPAGPHGSSSSSPAAAGQQLLYFGGCAAQRGNGRTRHLDTARLFSVANLSHCESKTAKIWIRPFTQIWLFREHDILWPAVELATFNHFLPFGPKTMISFAMKGNSSDVLMATIPISFNDHFGVYKVKWLTSDSCKNDSNFVGRIFFMENNRIRRVSELDMAAGQGHPNSPSLLIYSAGQLANGHNNNSHSRAYKLLIIGTGNCANRNGHSIVILASMRHTLVRFFRKNRHLLLASLALTAVLLLIFTISLLFFNISLAAWLSILFFYSTPFDAIFILLSDLFIFSFLFLSIAHFVRPLLRKLASVRQLNVVISGGGMANCTLAGLILAFALSRPLFPIPSIFLGIPLGLINILVLHKMFCSDLPFFAASSLQAMALLLQLPSIVTIGWRILKYGELLDIPTSDPFLETNGAIAAAVFALIFPKRSQIIRILPLFKLLTILCILMVFLRNPQLCFVVLDDLSLLSALILIYFELGCAFSTT